MGAMTVRQATMDAADLAAVIEMAAEMHPASTFAPMQFDGLHFGRFLVNLVAGDAHAVLIAEQDGAIVGGLLASCVPSIFGPDKVASEHGFFVRPAHRASRAAHLLLRAYVAWAREQGATRVNAGNSAGMDDSRYVRLMQSFGFTPAGSITYLNL